MPKHIKRITQTSALRDHEARLPQINQSLARIRADKANIERKCGLKFHTDHWRLILESVSIYCQDWCNEKNAISPAELKDNLMTLRKTAVNLLKSIYGENIDPNALNWKSKKWRTRCKKIAEVKNTSGKAGNNLFNLLCITVAGLNRFSKNIPKKNTQTLERGQAWKRWIYLVALIAQESGHEFHVRKDGGGRQSAIVLFIEELQKRLPAGMARLFENEMSRADAISKAWSKHAHRDLSFERAVKKYFRFRNPTNGRWSLSLRNAIPR